VKKLKLLLVAVVMTIAMSVGVVSPALAHKTCANNQHQHFIAGTVWYVYKTTQAGPNNIAKHWKWYDKRTPWKKWDAGYILC
jgi:hypothetical protein